jgi:hypothetical protein
MKLTGVNLLDAVAGRILARYVKDNGATGVMLVEGDSDPLRLSGVDLVLGRSGRTVKIKIKADPYFGTDPRKIADQTLSFYRGSANSYAFETISHHVTRDPGWMFQSSADEIFYYFLAIGQPEDEISALMAESDEVFLSELVVERDELHVLPMAPLREWFQSNNERYTPRPIAQGDHLGWHRIVPVADIDSVVPGVTVRGSVFARLSR